MNKGTLLYEMPDDIYKRNHRSFFYHYLIGATVVVLALLAIPALLFGAVGSALFCLLIALGLLLTESSLFKNPYFRFRLYEKGFDSACRPSLGFILRNEDYFVPFKEIRTVKFSAGESFCTLGLEDGRAITIGTKWNDVDGYFMFLRLLRKKYPEVRLPELEIVREMVEANERCNRKEISNTEFVDSYYKRNLEINKDFTYPRNKAIRINSPGQSSKPTCSHCGKTLDFIEEYDRWYCYNCEEYGP